MNYNRMIINLKPIKPDLFFLFISLFSGIVFLIFTPPFQVPDEINHFYKSYQISNGILFPETKDNRLGGYVPKSFIEITKPFLGLRWDSNVKTNFKTIKEQFSVPLNEDENVFVDFPNTALYSPISYIPQSVSIFILKKLDLPPLIIFYGARLFTLLTWILGIWLAIRITPISKWLFTLLALLPMSIFTNMSLSADVVTNICAFLFIAYLLKVVFQEKDFDLKNYQWIVILAIMIASAKIVYTPLILLFALIPVKKFKSIKNFSLKFTALLIIGFGTALFWSISINSSYIPFDEYNSVYRDGIDLVKCGSIQGQQDYILSHGWYIVNVLVNSMCRPFDMYYQGYIGTFGWLDTKLPMWLIHLSYIAIILTAIFENNKNACFNYFQRTVIIFSVFASIGLLLLSIHLTWDCIGANKVSVQGRYFIPVFPLLFILLNNSKNKGHFPTRTIVMLFSTLILLFSSWTLYSRYFIVPVFDQSIIQCDAEEVTPENLFKTSNPTTFLGNGITRNSKKFRSGNYSAQLFPERQYGFTYLFYDGEIGDIINIEVWRFGKSGNIVVSGESGKAFYITSSEASETDNNGWSKIKCRYQLQSNMKNKEIGIYLYNNGNDTCYFDDLSILISKLK
jgi:uncharacterized membrane protein